MTETRYVPLGLGFEASTEAHMKQTKRRDSVCRCHMPQEPLKLFQWNHPLALERFQAVQHRLTAQREGLFIDMLACQTQSKETVCVEEGSRHEGMRPSGRSQCTNQRDECIESCVSASTSRTGACEGLGSACEGLGSGCTGPRLVVIHRLSLARLSKSRTQT